MLAAYQHYSHIFSIVTDMAIYIYDVTYIIHVSGWLSISDSEEWSLCNPLNFYNNLYIGVSVFPHTDNPQSTGYK